MQKGVFEGAFSALAPPRMQAGDEGLSRAPGSAVQL